MIRINKLWGAVSRKFSSIVRTAGEHCVSRIGDYVHFSNTNIVVSRFSDHSGEEGQYNRHYRYLQLFDESGDEFAARFINEVSALYASHSETLYKV